MIRKKAAAKPEAKIEAKIVTPDVENTLIQSSAKETVSVKIKAAGEYASWGIELMHSVSLQDGENASDVMDGMIETLESKCAEFADSKSVLTDSDIKEAQIPEEIIEEEIIDDEVIDDGEDLTEEIVREMDKKEILALIKEQELSVDPKEFKKLPDLIDAVVAELFTDEVIDDEVIDDEVIDDDVIDDDLTEEMVREMDRKELTALIEEQQLKIDPKDFKKTADLTDAVVEALFAEELTPESIREMSKEELSVLIKAEKLDIDPKKFKKLDDLADEVIAILFEDDPEGEEGMEEFGDFDNVS